ncbi:hypothetical protein [Paraburkholderia sp. RL17-337-BIB-A]|uniref:hypothetical protein n=1 Tax=Paraburkholderia sp. RL17-337-BIB-A TaxID=3031636 RepID=UPI0038B71AEF
MIHSQTFHNYFLKELETASAITKSDADMRRHALLAITIFVAVATSTLSGCGADDAAPSSSSTTAANSDAAQNAAMTPLSPGVANNDVAQSSAINPATDMLNASTSLAAGPAAASDPITQNMQANLAADSQQIAPVMHYAPGDNASSN